MIDKIKKIVDNINTQIENGEHYIVDILDGTIDDKIELIDMPDGGFKVKYSKENWWIFDNEDLEFETVESLFKRNITIKNNKGLDVCYL